MMHFSDNILCQNLSNVLHSIYPQKILSTQEPSKNSDLAISEVVDHIAATDTPLHLHHSSDQYH
jgi:hypothetical protein